ncbi:hypothetical protein [Corynebacterium alimapuense]|uniref:Uncharacterized protein n=1 Tax=Corynebacterium alimapuense TaxID=1576874 RepID=A0A3M8K650_9CORY|nr:hypothetical protein [Corynebacterium alimapuense]RNE48052.1 hypothetical protein C5L39_10465 [Corynebacterium alimapuense]
MTDPKKESNNASVPINAPEVIDIVLAKIPSTEAFVSLKEIVTVVQSLVELHEKESTKREQLVAYRETEIARLQLAENTLHHYFDLIFAERRETNKRLFNGLDAAVRSGDVAAMQTVVGGIVQVAQTSPLADIGNLTGLIEAMDDPKAVFEL